MAVRYNPKIVTDGLVMAVDAGNTRSYPGTGTTWFDISGNNNNGTVVGDEVSFDSNNNSFKFLGAPANDNNDDYVSFPNTSWTLGANFTIEIWNYYDSDSTPTDTPWAGGCLYTNSAAADWNTGSGNNNGLLFGYNSIVYKNTSNSETQVDLSTSPATRVWHQHVMVVTSGTGKIYVDNVELATLSNMRTYTQSNGVLALGTADRFSNNRRGEYLGLISNARIYTKSLSTAQILQNYNALKGRFGL